MRPDLRERRWMTMALVLVAFVIVRSPTEVAAKPETTASSLRATRLAEVRQSGILRISAPLTVLDTLKVRFGAEDIATLNKIRLNKELGQVAAALLLTAPVIEMLMSPKPLEMLVTITTADFDKQLRAARGVAAIVNCQIVKDIDLREIAEPPPTPPAKRYFDRLRAAADRNCSGN